jgi:hypothetical protein
VSGRAPVEYVVGFPGLISPIDIFKILDRLMTQTRIGKSTYLEKELKGLKKLCPSVDLHYKAKAVSGEFRYVSADHFINEVGMTFKAYLERNGRVGPKNVLVEALKDLSTE